jgi:hypothetical protein
MSPNPLPSFSPQDITVDIANSTNCKITNLSIPLKNTEHSVVLSSNLKQLRIRCREYAILKYSFVSGDSGLKYWSIPKGCTENLIDLDFNGVVLYIQSSHDAITVEVMELY